MVMPCPAKSQTALAADRAHHGNQRARHFRRKAVERQDACHDHGGEKDSRQVDLRQTAQHLSELSNRPVGMDFEPEHSVQALRCRPEIPLP